MQTAWVRFPKRRRGRVNDDALSIAPSAARHTLALVKRNPPCRGERDHEPGAAAPTVEQALYRGNRDDFRVAREVRRAAIFGESCEDKGRERRRRALALSKYYINHLAYGAVVKTPLLQYG